MKLKKLNKIDTESLVSRLLVQAARISFINRSKLTGQSGVVSLKVANPNDCKKKQKSVIFLTFFF